MHVYCTDCKHFKSTCDMSGECLTCYCKDCECMNLEDSKHIEIRHKFEQKESMLVDIRDLEYLISMVYGYIDDELGGMESNTKHANRVREIMRKYNVKEVDDENI